MGLEVWSCVWHLALYCIVKYIEPCHLFNLTLVKTAYIEPLCVIKLIHAKGYSLHVCMRPAGHDQMLLSDQR